MEKQLQEKINYLKKLREKEIDTHQKKLFTQWIGQLKKRIKNL